MDQESKSIEEQKAWISLREHVPNHLITAQRIQLWAEALDASEALLLAGLRRQIGPDGDLRAAYREWYRQYLEEHDRTIARMLEKLAESNKQDGV